MLLSGAYDIPAVEVIVTGARTNKVPTAPYRGAGRPEATELIETAIDAAARQLGMDAVELRRRNLVKAFPYRTALGWTYDAGDFERCLDRALELLGEVEEGPHTGVGVALAIERSGGLYECAEVTREGVVRVGSIPAGSGHETLFAQIAAAKLGLDVDQITVLTGDTDELADGVGLLLEPLDGDGRLRRRRRGRRPARRRARRRALRLRSGVHVRRLRGGRRRRSGDGGGGGAPARRRDRRGHDPQPAAGRRPGDRRRGRGPRAHHRGRDPGVRHRVRGVRRRR